MEEYKIDPTISYDVVELPSKGIFYTNKKKTLKIAYLTASDENIITSPNLIASNMVVDELLKRKIIDKDIDIEEIVEEDRQAIMIFLRNTAFGTTYKIPQLIDPKTKEEFDGEIDLSTLKVKEFNLTEDSNGEYSYFLNKSQLTITFKFLSQKQENELKEMRESWNGSGAPPVITKKLEMMIKSVNGNRNPMDIYNFVNNKMPIIDSQDFRKFIDENKPGLDLNTEVTAPSGENIQVRIGFGAEFFRPFFGL